MERCHTRLLRMRLGIFASTKHYAGRSISTSNPGPALLALNGALVQLDGSPGSGQTQARAAAGPVAIRLHPIEGVENPRQGFPLPLAVFAGARPMNPACSAGRARSPAFRPSANNAGSPRAATNDRCSRLGSFITESD